MHLRSTLDLNLLFVLVALLETEQVSAAADRLNVTQSAVSQSLRRLREHFDDPLFVRTGNRLSPTPRAQALRTPIQRIAKDLHEHLLTSPTFNPATAERTFTLCLSDLSEFLSLSSFVEAFRRAAPRCRLRSLRAPVNDLIYLLETGQADLALGGMLPEMPPSLRQHRLLDYNYACIAGSANEAVDEALTREQYCQLPHVIVSRTGGFDDYVERDLRKLGLARHAVISLSDNIVAAKLVSESDMIATIPLGVAKRFSTLFPIKVLKLPFRLPQTLSRLYWHERFHRDPSHQWLRALAAEHLAAAG
ncbi:MAG: LysR family transcriptional regulator [Pigmentiphaga sp.]|nr:LysR family transcriptional regulator [Pigmentiphaga sp.]